MIRIGDFDLDQSEPRAHAHLLRTAWCPRTERDRRHLRLLLAGDRFGLLLAAGRLGDPAPAADDCPTREEALDAARAVLAREAAGPFESRLSRAPVASGRLLYLWDDGAPASGDGAPDFEPPFAVAKVCRDAEVLEREADAIRRLGSLPWEVSSLAPRVIAQGGTDLAVLAEAPAAGLPLLRLHRLAPRPGTWDPATFAHVGRWLGALHGITAAPDQRDALVAWCHGNLTTAHLFVRPARTRSEGGRLACATGLTRFSAEGDAAADVARFLVAAADEDLAGRGPAAEEVRASADLLGQWLFMPGSPAFAAVVECLTAWREMIADVARLLDVKALLLDRAVAALEQGRGAPVSEEVRDGLATFLSGPGVFADRRTRRGRWTARAGAPGP